MAIKMDFFNEISDRLLSTLLNKSFKRMDNRDKAADANTMPTATKPHTHQE